MCDWQLMPLCLSDIVHNETFVTSIQAEAFVTLASICTSWYYGAWFGGCSGVGLTVGLLSLKVFLNQNDFVILFYTNDRSPVLVWGLGGAFPPLFAFPIAWRNKIPLEEWTLPSDCSTGEQHQLSPRQCSRLLLLVHTTTLGSGGLWMGPFLIKKSFLSDFSSGESLSIQETKTGIVVTKRATVWDGRNNSRRNFRLLFHCSSPLPC